MVLRDSVYKHINKVRLFAFLINVGQEQGIAVERPPEVVDANFAIDNIDIGKIAVCGEIEKYRILMVRQAPSMALRLISLMSDRKVSVS